MTESTQQKLSRREREIMDVIYQLGRATVAEVIDQMEDPPSYSAVRALMGILEEKGQLRHETEGARYVYVPVIAREKARKNALQSLLKTFFDGEARQAIAALLELPESGLSRSEAQALSTLIEKAKREGR